MKTLIAIILAVIYLNISVFAQTNTSSTGELIKNTENGFSFNSPKDWKSQSAEDGYVLLNSDKTASIVVKPHFYDAFESFVKAEVNLERDGFTQAGEVQDLGNGGRMFRSFRANGDKNVIVDTFFLLSPNGGGLIIVGLTSDNTMADNVYHLASQLIKTIRYSAPQQSNQSLQLKTAFSGKKLSFFYTGNGYSERRTIVLCGSGRFFSNSESSSVSGLGTGATSSNDQGIWKIQTSGNSAVLVLDSQQGNGQRRFTITARQASNEIGLNNSRYFVESHNQCQ